MYYPSGGGGGSQSGSSTGHSKNWTLKSTPIDAYFCLRELKVFA